LHRLLRDCATISSFPSCSGADDQLQKRDETIARRHIELKLDDMLTEEVKTWLLDMLPRLSQGNAIWIDMVTRNIEKSRMRNKAALQRMLNAPGNLAQTYTDLFEQVVMGIEANRRFLSAALEILVTVRRPVDILELVYGTAVALEIQDTPADRPALSKLSQVASLSDIDVDRLTDLIGPFVMSLRNRSSSDKTFRVVSGKPIVPVHASLTEWTRLVPPLQWKDNLGLADLDVRRREELQKHRNGALEGTLLRICMTYLLLDDFNHRYVFTAWQEHVASEADGLLLSDYNQSDDKGQSNISADEAHFFFDPADQNFGPLYAYTASFWTSHLQEASQESWPLMDQLQKLCAHRSKRFRNWCHKYRRLDSRNSEQRDMPCQDPLGVVARFGSPIMLRLMLQESDLADEDTFHRDSLFEALRLALDHEDFVKCRVLFQYPSIWYDRFFHEALACYHRKREGGRPLAPGWHELFSLVHDITDALTQNKLGNVLVCNAARHGCVPLLRHLLDASNKDPEVMDAVLTPWPEPAGADQNTAWQHHQSIARAVRFSHAGAVRFLLASWPEMERHFTHRDSFGFNVFHIAAQCQSSAETVALLLNYSTEGVNAETAQGDTPLNLYAFAPNCNLECVRLLLEVGKADVRGGDGPPPPLQQAAMNGNEELCRLLVSVGRADPRSVLRLRPGEVPKLLHGINVGKIDVEEQSSRERRLLEVLCGLARLDPAKEMELM